MTRRIKYYTAKIDGINHHFKFYDENKQEIEAQTLPEYKIKELPNIIQKINQKLKSEKVMQAQGSLDI